ncbi:monosaccharide ABC transporter substrate-binding protein, CUT2 family [Micromonospora pattaloongensis]|uniref:Monosaccharide ABC transporter substrate-binding protein, CUT2 family n=1 Tax=Micromonospora pattaloongensis TaxID=405436 RepID=A0A1H3RUL9_9ACTN|nr:TMAO reductase system periplasmic protein TorT [Micromonospora pattaloongensis]SDZ29005.1 monosaccharide ABC transporter substrate-binding protein, CUT2 family [Micromonospora pattaloongensis]
MPKGKAKAAALVAAAALLLSACSAGQDSEGGASKYDPSKPIPGSDKGSFTATAAEIKEALKTDPWWYPTLFVDCKDAATKAEGCNGERTEGVYNAIPKDLVSKRWKICFAVPHVSDPYWVAADFGAVEEARRLGVDLDVYEAGGYTELSKQLNQIDDCVSSGAEAIVIGAISFNGLDAKVEQLVDQGIVVIDGLNGISNPKVSGRAVLNWREMGGAVGDYLKKQNKSEKVAWFPGPPGAGWAEDATAGFNDAIKGAPVSVAATKYGDTSKEVQLKLLEDTLQADPGISVIAGTAVTADAAVAGNVGGGKAKIYADYLIPSTFDAIKDGKVTCGVSDQPVIQARMAIDMAVRLLEKIPLDDQKGRAFPAPKLVCGPDAGADANLDSFIPETTFAPADFKPVFRVTK